MTMPVPRRYRFVIAFTGALFAGALLTPVPATASTTVTFNGASVLGLLGCTSRPDTGSLSVSAESTVTFVNHLGESASLRVNGQDVGSVPANRGLPLLFHRGPVTVTMIPGCLLGGGSAGTVTVWVSASSRGGPSATVVGGLPTGIDPSSAGLPNRTKSSPSPGASASTSPDPSESAPDPASALADPSAVDDPSTGPVAVQPVVPASGDQHQTSNVLVLTAIICVIGVSIAAIRAMIAQRAAGSVPG